MQEWAIVGGEKQGKAQDKVEQATGHGCLRSLLSTVASDLCGGEGK